MTTPLEKAIKIFGTQSALAKALGINQQNVSYWIAHKIMPSKYVLSIEKATKGEVSCHELRPDIYPRDRVKSKLAK